MLGAETPVRLQLLELPAALGSLDGVRMELEDCAFPLLDSIACTADTDEAFAGAELGAPRRRRPAHGGDGAQGPARHQRRHLHRPGRGDRPQRRPTDCRVLVVGNPCNTNALIGSTAAARHGMPKDRWFAMTMLDESRGRSQLARRRARRSREVRDLAIWGNHSSTQFPDAWHATIGGRPRSRSSPTTRGCEGEFIAASSSAARRSSRRAASRARGQRRERGHRHGPQRGAADGEIFSSAIPAPAEGGYDVPEAWSSATPCAPRRPDASRSSRASSTATSRARSRPPPPSCSRSAPRSRTPGMSTDTATHTDAALRIGDERLELPIVDGTRGRRRDRHRQPARRDRADHLRPRLRQHRRLHERDHVPRRRGRASSAIADTRSSSSPSTRPSSRSPTS